MTTRERIKRRPTETVAASAGTLVAILVGLGLDEPTAAWIALGLGLLPGIITSLVEWWRSRPAR